MVEIILQDHRGSHRVNFATLPDPAQIAALRTQYLFSLLGGKTFVPHFKWQAQHAGSYAGEILGTPCLSTL